MRGFRTDGLRGSRGVRGLTLGEALIAVAVAFLLAVLLLPVLARHTGSHAYGARCRANLIRFYQGLRMYLNNSDEYFPPAWHVGGEKLAEDFGNLTYYRFLIEQISEGNFNAHVYTGNPQGVQGDLSAGRRELLTRNALFWSDPLRGWTADYFAPDFIFKMPRNPRAPFDKGRQFGDIAKYAPLAERPLFTEVNASLPDPKASDPNDPGHELEMKKGFSFVHELGADIFVGVGRSATDYATSRFDFRHNGTINVIFLDGHVDTVKSTEAQRLVRIHDGWNHLVPEAR